MSSRDSAKDHSRRAAATPGVDPAAHTDIHPKASKEAVVLVHGVWCMALVMWYLAWQLHRCGYKTYCFSYASVLRSFAGNVETLATKIDSVNQPTVHLVAHSYGGLVLTQLLDQASSIPSGRMVLLGSPVRGARLAAGVMQGRFRHRLLGYAAHSPLVSGLSAQTLQRVALKRPVGVVSGTLNKTLLGLIFGRLDAGDGLVANGETSFPGAQHTELDVSHAGMLFSAAVAARVIHFLRFGNFLHTNATIKD